jgi:cardiolipin synthase
MMKKKWSFKNFKSIPADQKRITFSTMITLVRIVLVPIIVASMVQGKWDIAFWLFLIATISDVLDGNLARWLNEQTFLGACLDPVADKLLIVSCFATLAFVQSPLFAIPQWFVLIVLIKELVLLLGALVIFLYKGSLSVRPTKLGKMTMLVQSGFIIWLFACYFLNRVPVKTYWAMLGLLLFLTVASLIQYIRIGWRQLKA